MTEIEALDSILADLAARGYDDAKLGVARNVLGRFARFLGERPLSETTDADAGVFLEKVTASGASEKAIAVFRTVMNDAAPTITRFRREATAPVLPEMAEPEMEALAAAPAAELPPEPPAPEAPHPPSEHFTEPPPLPEPASLMSALVSEEPAPPPRVTVPTAEPLPDFPMEEMPGLAEPPTQAHPLVTDEQPLPAALPLPEVEAIPGLASPEPLAEPSAFDIPAAPPSATTELPSGIDWEAPAMPATGPVEALPEPGEPVLPLTETPLAELPSLEAAGVPVPLPLSDAALAPLPDGLLEPAPPVDAMVAPAEAPLLPEPLGTLPELPLTEPLAPAEPLPLPEPLATLPELPLPEMPPPPVELLGMPVAIPEEEPPAPPAPLPELTPPAEPPIFAPRDTMMAQLSQELLPAPAPAEPAAVEVPPELVARLTPRPTAEMPPVAAPELFEKSASDLLASPLEEPAPPPPADTDPKEARRALVRDNLAAVLPTLLGQLEGSDRENRDEARGLLAEAGIAAAPQLVDAAVLGSPALAAELFALLQKIEGPEVPRLVFERLQGDLADPLAVVAAGGEPAIQLLLRHLPHTDEFQRAPLGNWIEGNPEIAVAPLLEAMGSADGDVKGYALRALGFLGRPEGIPGLLHGLDSSDDDTRSSSAMALVRMGRAAVDGIGEILLRTRDSDVQYESAKALGMIGHPAAIAYLGQALADGKVPHTAADALVKIGSMAIGTLEEQLSSEDPMVRAVSAGALGRIGDPVSKPRLLRLLGDRDAGVQDEVRNALSRLGATAEELIPPPADSAGGAEGAPPSRAAEIAALRGRILSGDASGALAAADELLRHRSQLSAEELPAALLAKARAHEALGQAWEAIGALDQLLFVDDENEEARALHEELSKRG